MLEGSGLLLSSAAEPLLTYRKIKYPMMNDNNRNNDAATAEAIIRIFMLLLFGVLGDVGYYVMDWMWCIVSGGLKNEWNRVCLL